MRLSRWWTGWLVVGVLLLSVGMTQAQQGNETVYDGFLDNTTPERTYPIVMEPGQALLVVAEATSGDLDTVVSVYSADGRLVAQNDDRADDTLDSALGYISQTGGPYKVQIARYADTDTSGHYTLRIVIGSERILDELADITRVQLSGPMQTLDTPNFRIHYTLSGQDAALSQAYVEYVAEAAEAAWQTEVVQMGWPVPPGDGVLGGDPRFDIYLQDLLGSGEEALGYAVPDVVVGDNPNTPFVETAASGSYLIVENDFDSEEEDAGDPFSLLRTTVVHELNHALQFGFDANDSHNWIYEATATWMETAAAGKDQDATGYVVDAYQYPELCFGTVNDPGEGAVQYGEWPFLQAMVDDLGPDAVLLYWGNLAEYDGWAALEQTLTLSGETLPDFVARYRVKNLARDYDLAPLFGATVWLENTITESGRWTVTGEGIQDLGANYFRLDLPAGIYYAGLVNDDGTLQVWAIGVDGRNVSAIPLGRGDTFDTRPYTSVYLMVFSPTYDDDVSDCVYASYDLDIARSKDPAQSPAFTFPSTHYEALTSGS